MGKKNPTRKSDKQKSKDRLEVRKAAAVADVVIPALTKHQMDDATSKALFLFNEKLLQVRKLNEGKVIVVNIAVTAEGLHPSRRKAGRSLVKEMQQASLWNNAGMANLGSSTSSVQRCIILQESYSCRAESVWSSWGTIIQH